MAVPVWGWEPIFGRNSHLDLIAPVIPSASCPSFCLYELDFGLTFSVACGPVSAAPAYLPCLEAALAFDFTVNSLLYTEEVVSGP